MSFAELRPHPEYPRLERAVRRLVARGLPAHWSGACYRFASAKWGDLSVFLTGKGTLRFGSRWLAPGIAPAVYASLSPETALRETLAQQTRFGLPAWQAMPLLVRGVSVEVEQVVDLTDGATRAGLRTSAKRLFESDWRAWNSSRRETLAQALGRAVLAARVEGLLVPSAEDPEGTNLVVFPEVLRPGSRLSPLP